MGAHSLARRAAGRVGSIATRRRWPTGIETRARDMAALLIAASGEWDDRVVRPADGHTFTRREREEYRYPGLEFVAKGNGTAAYESESAWVPELTELPRRTTLWMPAVVAISLFGCAMSPTHAQVMRTSIDSSGAVTVTMPARDAERGSFLFVAPDGSAATAMRCVPDTVDPRGPKGK